MAATKSPTLARASPMEGMGVSAGRARDLHVRVGRGDVVGREHGEADVGRVEADVEEGRLREQGRVGLDEGVDLGLGVKVRHRVAPAADLVRVRERRPDEVLQPLGCRRRPHQVRAMPDLCLHGLLWADLRKECPEVRHEEDGVGPFEGGHEGGQVLGVGPDHLRAARR